MKKILLLMMALVAVGGVKAGEYVAFQPSSPVAITSSSAYDTYSNSSDGTFTYLNNGDVIKVHITNVENGAYYSLQYKTGDGWSWTDLVSSTTIPNNGVITYTITSEEIATLIKTRGLVVKADNSNNYKLLDITVETNEYTNNSQTLFTGASYTLGNYVWDERIQLPNYASIISKAKAGDVMTVSFTTVAGYPEGTGESDKVCKVEIRSDQSDGNTIVAKSGDLTTLSTSGTISVTLTDEMITSFKSTGCVWGAHVIINAITISSEKLTSEVAISNNTIYFGNWTNTYSLNNSNMTGISVGDFIKVSYSVPGTATDGRVFLRSYYNGAWQTIEDCSDYSSLSGTGTVTFTVNQAMLDLVASGQTISVLGSGANVADATGVSGTGCSITHYTDLTMAGYRPVYIPAGGYATFYGTSTCALPSDVKAYYIPSVEDGKAKLTEISNIPANQGVILKGVTGIYQLYTTDVAAASVTSNKLAGAATRTQITTTTDKYILYDNSGTPEFRKITTDSYLDAYKCYLDASRAAARLSLSFDDETTSINMVQTSMSDVSHNQYFDLQGRHVAIPQKGLYIFNGKKVIIK